MTTEEARKWMVDVAGWAPREPGDWEAEVTVEAAGYGFLEMTFRRKNGKLSGCRVRDPETTAMLVPASMPTP